MSFIGSLLSEMERSSAGSEETARQVLSLCGDIAPKTALFIGDDCYTPSLIAEKTGAVLKAGFPDAARAEKAKAMGLNGVSVQRFEFLQSESGFDMVWYNGVVEFDSITERLARLKSTVAKGGTAVFRTLCWIIDPSPDTESYCTRRFGIIEPLDKVLREAKEAGFAVRDLYIAPKSDWTEGLYRPLNELAAKFSKLACEEGEVAAGMNELKKETDMFMLHCEEYSYVYYIMKG